MRSSLLLATLPLLCYVVSAAPSPAPKNNAATAQCITHLEGLTTQVNAITKDLTPDQALGRVGEIQSAHVKAVEQCCQATVDARSVVDQYTTVAPQVTQALGFLSGLSKSIPDVGGLQNQFTELPTSLLECSKKYLQQQQQEA